MLEIGALSDGGFCKTVVVSPVVHKWILMVFTFDNKSSQPIFYNREIENDEKFGRSQTETIIVLYFFQSTTLSNYWNMYNFVTNFNVVHVMLDVDE